MKFQLSTLDLEQVHGGMRRAARPGGKSGEVHKKLDEIKQLLSQATTLGIGAAPLSAQAPAADAAPAPTAPTAPAAAAKSPKQ